MRMRLLMLAIVLSSLGGCAVYAPAPGPYVRPYYPPPVAVYPRPYYGGYGYGGYGYGYRRW